MKSQPYQAFTAAVIAIAALLALPSCKKEAAKTTAPAVSERTRLLTLAPWHRSAWEVLQSDSTWLSLDQTDYQKSDRFTYNADHTLTGSSLGQSGQTVYYTATWKFSDGEQSVVVTFPDGSKDVRDIGVLTETLLRSKEYHGPYNLPDANGRITNYYGVRFSWAH